MRKTQLENEALRDLRFWVQHDRKMLDRILRLIEECQCTPFEGIGKPEPLKGELKGYWSRRIDDEHRMVYEVTDELIVVYSLHGHYNK